MKKIKLLLCKTFAFTFLILTFSCSKDSMVDSKGEISTKLLTDPLFEKIDLAFYDVELNLLKYKGEKINQKLAADIKEDLKNRKIKSFKEFYELQAKAGQNDYEKRIKANLKFSIIQQELFKKYPELVSNKKEFTEFFMKNRKHTISPEIKYEYYKKSLLLKN